MTSARLLQALKLARWVSDRRQSACQPITRRYCVDTAKNILKRFHCRVATPF